MNPMELAGRLENNSKQTITRYCGDLDGAIVPHALLTEAAACIREMVEWRPIETAPRDGTEIVGFDLRTGTAHVTSADQWGQWVDPDSHYYSEAEPFKPTHWLPLPLAPGAEA